MSKHILFLVILFLGLLPAGCRKFEDINTDPTRPSTGDPAYLLSYAEKRAVDIFYDGAYNGKLGMQYAQYWTQAIPTQESRYQVNNDGIWAQLYAGPLMDLREIEHYYSRNPQMMNPHTLAVARILKAWIFHTLTDMYVDIPFSQALRIEEIPYPAYDHAADIYTALLGSLQTQIEVLEQTTAPPIEGDLLAGGDVQRWIKIANALRLRIAMRMSDVRPDEAASVIGEASQHTFTSVADDLFFAYDVNVKTNQFPYNDNERQLFEFAMSSTLIDYMKATGDPRLPVYARLPASGGNEYRGKPYGRAENTPVLNDLSIPGRAVYAANMRGYIITYAETEFIKAEAAARGMNVGGTAREFYESGIRASMDQWRSLPSVTIDSLAEEQYLRSVPYNAGNWKNVIGTQKWLALYMQGFQAWIERLRLDFKKPDGTDLFIPPVSGSLDPDVTDVPRRLAYPGNERNSNSVNCNAAARRIGGDTKGTRNWWDIN